MFMIQHADQKLIFISKLKFSKIQIITGMKLKALGILALSAFGLVNSEIMQQSQQIQMKQPDNYIVYSVLGDPFQGDIKVSFGEDFVNVQGCNIHNAQLQRKGNSENFSIGLFRSTRRFCQEDRDSEILDYIKFAKSFMVEDNIMKINAQNGDTIFELFREGTQRPQNKQMIEEQQKQAPIPDIPLPNQYKLILENSDLAPKKVELTQDYLYLCCDKKYRIPYTTENKEIRFGQIQTPLKEDQQEQHSQIDSAFLEVIKNTRYYQWINFNLIHLKDQNKQTIAILNPKLSHFYSLSYNYRQFQGKFLVRNDDPVIDKIRDYAQNTYSHYIDHERVTSAFKMYLLQETQYSVLFMGKQKYQRFMLVMNYNPQTEQLTMKSLTLLNFDEIQVDNKYCKTVYKSKCYDCKQGYNFYKGRCFPVSQDCAEYDLDQCKRCKQGYKILRGKCIEQ